MNKVLYWFATGCALLAFLLAATNICLIKGNQEIQRDIGFKQNIISTAVNVSSLNQQLAQALYDAGMKTKDQKIKALLIEQGFELDKTPAPEAKDKAQPKPKKAVEE